MKKILFILTLVPLLTFGQSGFSFFGGQYSSFGQSFKKNSNGNYIFCGSVITGENYGMLPLIGNYSSGGNFLWSKTYFDGFESIFDGNDGACYSICESNEDEFTLVGYRMIPENGLGEYTEGFIMKVDSEGNELYSMATEEKYSSIIYLSDNTFLTSNDNGSDLTLSKLDSEFNILWEQSFDDVNRESFGGPASFSETNDSGLIISSSISNVLGERPIIIKTDGNGNQEWSETIHASNSNIANGSSFSSLQTTDNQGYLVASNIEMASVGQALRRIEFTKLDMDGNIISTIVKDGPMIGRDMKSTLDGGLITCGFQINDEGWPQTFLMKTDQIGNELWYKIFSSEEFNGIFSVEVQETDAGDFLIMSNIDRDFNPKTEILIIKTDSQGNLLSSDILEINENKTLLKTIDILGRDSENKPFSPLIDLYDDGSAKKRMIIEF